MWCRSYTGVYTKPTYNLHFILWSFFKKMDLKILSMIIMLEPVYRWSSSQAFGNVKIYNLYENVFILYILFWLIKDRPKNVANISLFLIPVLFFEISSYLFNPIILARTPITFSLLLFLTIIYSENRIVIKPKMYFQIFKGIIIGGAFLGGYVFSGQFLREVVFTLKSSFGASAGLPPIHVSVLLSLSILCRIILLHQNRFSLKTLNYLLIFPYVTLMLLTFSRTGFYALIISCSIYFC